MKMEHFPIMINKEAVFQMIGCERDNSVYDEVSEAYEELLPLVYENAECQCLFDFAALTAEDAVKEYPEGTKVVYVISTVGKTLSGLSTGFFEKGDCLKGMLADAMADSCLFELEQQWKEPLKQFCREHHVGIGKRLEAPYDLPMTVQKTAFEVLRAKEKLGLSITSGFMYDPMKSACQVFVLTEDVCQFRVDHDCGTCPALNCKLRRRLSVEVTVYSARGKQKIICEEKESILSAYQRQSEPVSAVCGGKGNCGKCKIRLLEGVLPITEADRRLLSEEELQEGYRLSCRAIPIEPCSIQLCFGSEEGFQAVDAFIGSSQEEKVGTGKGQHIGIAVDIGTTTLAAQLVDRVNGQILQSVSSINHQRAFGADVISRIEASAAGREKELQTFIRKDLQKLIKTLLESSGVSGCDVEIVTISGNTTMGHLLMGYSCKTLGVFPFQPVNICTVRGTFDEIIGAELLEKGMPSCDVVLLPGISTYVGGDIVAGLYACGFDKSEQINLLVDLGTNGEMAIGNKDRILVTSTAAGPAFEGGNISCGTGSVSGAICHVKIYDDRKVSVETIHNQSPIGICGTGVVEITAELLSQEIIDETGLLDEEYFEEGFLVAVTEQGEKLFFTQKDIREVQLAKSAVRAGVEMLIRRYGVSYQEIGKVYLAGGMGFQMNCEAAVTMGLFPKELLNKITAVGNSSLAGSVKALQTECWKEDVERFVDISREIALANDAEFNDLYMEHMLFGNVED